MGYRSKEKISLDRVHFDLRYIILNKLINQIPIWWLRRRIYIKMGMTIGENARIGIGTVVINPLGIKIGDRSVVNENCLLDGRGGIVIGHDTSISMYSKILTASHKSDGKNFDYYIQKTKIGNYVWIGTSAIILNGSILKDYTIIGAGAVLKGKAEEKSIMIGNPARCVKKRGVDVEYKIKYKAYFR